MPNALLGEELLDPFNQIAHEIRAAHQGSLPTGPKGRADAQDSLAIRARPTAGCSLLPVRTTREAIAAAALAALIAVACAADDDAATPAPDSPPATAAATATEQPTAAAGQPVTATPSAAPAPDATAPETPSATAVAAPIPSQPAAAPATATAIPTADPTQVAATPTAAPPTPVQATPAPTASPPTGSTVLDVLNSLPVESEYRGSGYERDDFEHHRGYLCDASGIDPYTGVAFDASTCDVDHIVAAQEAFESGAWEWDVARRRAFGNDASNLVPSRDCVNRSKGARDMAEWSGRIGSGTCQGLAPTAQGRCFMASKMVEVKSAFGLSVDQAEKNALAQALDGCPAGGPAQPSSPSGFQTGPTQPTPTEAATATTGGSDCHPAYSPCLPNLAGDALNCGDLTADQRPVTVLTPGVDPYRLDRDRDGRGCTS